MSPATFITPTFSSSFFERAHTNFLQNEGDTLETIFKTMWEDPSLEYACFSGIESEIASLNALKERVDALPYARLIVLGMGASINNPAAILGFAEHHTKGSMNARKREIVFVHDLYEGVIDNAASGINPEKCGFLVISKSGNTLETMALALAARTWIFAQKLLPKNHMIMITEVPDSPLGKLANQESLTHLFTHPPIGGRFAIFTQVTLVPGLFAGLDMESFLKGALLCLEEAKIQGAQSSVGESVLFHLYHQSMGRFLYILEMYDPRLQGMGRWMCQMWAESLGKNEGAVMPILSRGPFDHHSQWQLYLACPKNLYMTLWSPMFIKKEHDLGSFLADESTARAMDMPSLASFKMRGVRDSTRYGAESALKEQGIPYGVWEFEETCDNNMLCSGGYMMMHTLLTILSVGRMMEVDPFGQPAVESLKKGAREFMQDTKKIQT